MRRSLPLVSLFLAGCLTSTHVIPREELMRLAQTPPERRGDRVRVIQGFAGAEEPPMAPRVGFDAEIIIVNPHLGGPSVGSALGQGLAKAKVDSDKWWLVIAAITAVVLAATEGARYDGWVKLHPMHPVHLYGLDGSYTWLPLAQIDPQTAMWAAKAFVREGEGPWLRLGRAPLNREGWTYSMLFGAAQIPSRDGTTPTGFLGHIQIGNFPLPQFGVLLDISLGGSDDLAGNVVADSRYQLEVQLLPLAARPFHAGVYGDFGLAYRFEDGNYAGESGGVGMGTGVMLQLELTTRLAITARAGVARAYAQTTTEAVLGLSVY